MAEAEMYPYETLRNWVLISTTVGATLGVVVTYEFYARASKLETILASIGLIATCWIVTGLLDAAYTYLKE